jgi:DNA-binding winged helix-turn-helix (wHTH) protein
MTPPDTPAGWFCALLDAAPDVYFRYSLRRPRGFVYVSSSVQTLTGHSPEEFYRNPDGCLGLIPSDDRRRLRQLLRARKGRTLVLHVLRGGVAIPIELRSVAVVRHRQVVAIEGVVTLSRGSALPAPGGQAEPTQQRLAALMYEVHELLHRVLPAAVASTSDGRRVMRALHLGELTLDVDRLVVTEAGKPVALTSREVMVLRYLLERIGRVVTRPQLLSDVWAYTYTGDDRTVDVHISRLRRKLPSLRGRLVAIKGLGYRLEIDGAAEDDERRIANC